MIIEILNNLIIEPIKMIMEMVFSIIYRFGNNAILAILGVSIVVSVLTLPLYNKAEEIQKEERDKQSKMEKWIQHIKKTFSGDEKFFMQTTYYRQQNYKPIYALRSSISLLLQIPFFMAAYAFLSNLKLLEGASFWIINDLGKPDQLLTIGNISINVLPIAMTLLNLLSAMVYSKGLKLKDKIQPIIIALVFLVLLYNSPSGLVIYWTFNQIFSLIKNIVKKNETNTNIKEPIKIHWREIIIPEIGLFVLMGLIIPLSVIGDSPKEFVSQYGGPWELLLFTATVYFGLFVIWFNVFVALSNKKTLPVLNWIINAGFLIALIDYFIFAKKFGLISTYFVFDNMPTWFFKEKLINLVVVLVCAILCFVLQKKHANVLKLIAGVLSVGLIMFSVTGIVKCQQRLGTTENKETNIEKSSEIKPVFSLSKTKRNVVVIMLDRAIGPYVPYIFRDNPELQNQYSGFIYYENTTSFGLHTNYAAPAVFGGYEYTPEKMNQRKDELLKDKHNEALKMMPALFDNEHYLTTVCDLPLANYKIDSDLSIFEEYPNIRIMHTKGKYVGDSLNQYMNLAQGKKDKGALYYSVFRVAPLCIQGCIYGDGYYFDENSRQNSKLPSYTEAFIDWFTVLSNLGSLTSFDANCDTFLELVNEATHEPTMLSVPSYEIGKNLDSLDSRTDRFIPLKHPVKIETEHQLKHYDINAASLIQIGKWIDILKQEGAYDNTRIIIVSDHGANLGSFDELITTDGFDAEGVASLLLVKDFNSKDVFKTSDEFMTVADVPSVAMRGCIENPVNPFTGNNIDEYDKQINTIKVIPSTNCDTNKNNGTQFDSSDSSWYLIHDDIWKKENWELIGKELPEDE